MLTDNVEGEDDERGERGRGDPRTRSWRPARHHRRGRSPRARRDPGRGRSWTCLPRTGRRGGPSELARRLGLPKSSIANICAALADAGSPGAWDRVRARPQAGRARWRLPGVRRPDPGVLRRLPRARGRVRRDDPAGRARWHRDDVPGPARRPPARPADLADRPAPAGQRHGDRQGGAGVTGRDEVARRFDGVGCRPSPAARCRPSTRCSRISRSSADAATRWTTRRRSKASSASASRPRPGTGEGPYAASITLLKAAPRSTGCRS